MQVRQGRREHPKGREETRVGKKGQSGQGSLWNATHGAVHFILLSPNPAGILDNHNPSQLWWKTTLKLKTGHFPCWPGQSLAWRPGERLPAQNWLHAQGHVGPVAIVKGMGAVQADILHTEASPVLCVYHDECSLLGRKAQTVFRTPLVPFPPWRSAYSSWMPLPLVLSTHPSSLPHTPLSTIFIFLHFSISSFPKYLVISSLPETGASAWTH